MMIKPNEMVTVASPRGWIRSSRCTPNSNCMEVLLDKDLVGVRDSKSASTGNLAFAHRRWADFLGMITS